MKSMQESIMVLTPDLVILGTIISGGLKIDFDLLITPCFSNT